MVSLANASYSRDCPFAPQPPHAPFTPGVNLTAVAWTSGTVAWTIGGATGMVLKSTDAGATWPDASRLPDGTCPHPRPGHGRGADPR